MVNVSGLSKGHGFSGTIKRHNFHSGPRSNKKVTVKHLQVVKVDGDRNLIFVRGAVPGAKNSIIVVRKD